MFGMLVMSEDGEITAIILPNPENTEELLLMVRIGVTALPMIPIPVRDLSKVMEQVVGK